MRRECSQKLFIHDHNNRLRQHVTHLSTAPRSEDATDNVLRMTGPSDTSVLLDELVLAGNESLGNLDNVDFADFRNDSKLAKKMLAEIRRKVEKFHPEGHGKAYNEDVRRVFNARYAQGHGVQVQAHLDGSELSKLRKYLQREDSSPNVADAVRSINSSLISGQQDVEFLIGDAERALFAERGVKGERFDTVFSGLSPETLKKTRDFAGSWANSESGKFLSVAQGTNFNELRESMARSILSERGYQGAETLDLDTVLSLVRDIDVEGPTTSATIKVAVNAAIRQGETNYFELSRKGNEAILQELGLDSKRLATLRVSDKELKNAYPDLAPAEARAVRTRVLRDLLRVCPDGERTAALDSLNDADLIGAEKVLSKHFGRRIRHFGSDAVEYTEMGAMQRANLASGLSKLPEQVRNTAFGGAASRSAANLAKVIETQFGVNVHRKAGRAPNGNSSYSRYVQTPPVQTLTDLYNALASMSKDGKLPQNLGPSTTVAYMAGAPKSPSMTPVLLRQTADPVGPWDRPGSWVHREGKSGYFGECSQDEEGHDGIFLFDDATLGPNGDGQVGVSQGEGTLIHELSHAMQLGGTPGAPTSEREASDRLRTAEWASLSRWTEPDMKLADGAIDDYFYYYDPAVQVSVRSEVATSYGASDPAEDFAEFSPFFFKDPSTAMKLSPTKFLYLNGFTGGFYDESQLARIGEEAGLNAEALRTARIDMEAKVSRAPLEAAIA